MKNLRTQWLTEFVNEVNKNRAKEQMQLVAITDCISMSFFIFDFHAPGLPDSENKEKGALVTTWDNLKTPNEPFEKAELATVHKLLDRVPMANGYDKKQVKNIVITLNFREWSIAADIEMKNGERDVKKWG